MAENDLFNSFAKEVNDLYSGKSNITTTGDLGIALSSPNPMQVKQKISGISPKPMPSSIPPGSNSSLDYNSDVNAIRDYLDGKVNSYADKNEWSQAYSYNAGPSGTYFTRYSPLADPGKIKFHPNFNNEAILNKNTTFLGDLWRTTTQAFVPLAWNGIKSVYSSMGRIFNEGDFLGEDPELAREYARITAKNYSSKDNIGSFVNNLVMNLGYTTGIMATAMFENWIGASTSAFIGARTVIPKASNLLFKEYQAGKAFDGIKTYSKMLDEYKDINKVRAAFEEANGIGKIRKGLESKVGTFLNPLNNLTDNYYALANKADDFTGYMQSSRTMYNTAGAAYRDLRNINLALSEARLESGMVYNNLVDELNNDFYNKQGRGPTNDEMQDIINQAKRAAYETSFMNAGLIYYTNKITFDNILNPRVGAQGYLKQKIVDWKTVGGGRFGELGSIAFDVAANEWKFYEKGFKTWWNKLKTDPFHKSFYGTVGYLKSNILEGVQESLQETISYANEKYYKDSFYTDAVRKNLVSKAAFGQGTTPLSYYGQGLEKQFSAEGLATFASGFAMGSLGGGLNRVMTTLYEKANQIFDPTGYDEYVKEKTKIKDKLVNKMNAFSIEDFMNSKLFNGGAQQILADVQEQGNKKEVMDVESESLIRHFTTLNEYGVLDLYLDAVSSFKNMTNAEFMEAFPKVEEKDIPAYKARIDNTVAQAKQIKERMDVYNKAYPNPIDLSKFSKDDYDYEDAYIMHHAWNWGIKSAVFYNEVFEDARKRMVDIMNKHYSERPLQGMTKRQSDIILRPEEMQNEIGLLKNEANNLIAVGDPESKKAAKDKLKQAEALQKYYEAYQEFSDYYGRDRYFNRAKQILQKEKAEGEEVTDEEVNKYLDDSFGPKSDEKEKEILLKLETEYKNLLKNISSKPDDYLFTNKVDDAFELVLDFYKLNDESRQMVDVINLMNDPQGFIDVYNRNLKWMNDLWLKKGDYYREIVTQELSHIEDNGLLNFLAYQGIFMEANDFILWRDQGIPPKEFYDERKNLVVPEGSLAYDRYMQHLIDYAQLKEKFDELSDEANTQSLQARIEELNKRKEKQIQNLGVQFRENLLATTGKTLEEWELMQPEKPTGRTKEEIQADIDGLEGIRAMYEDALTNLSKTNDVAEILNLWSTLANQNIFPDNIGELIDAEIVKDKKAARKLLKKLIETNDQEAAQQAISAKYGISIALNNKIAELTKEEPISEDTFMGKPLENTEAWKDYQKQLDKVNERYKAFVKKLQDQLKTTTSETVPTAPAAPKKKTTTTKVNKNATWDNLPEELKKELQTLFDSILSLPVEEGGLGQPKDLKNISISKYENIRNNWLTTQGALIDEYNDRAVEEEDKPIEFKFLTLSLGRDYTITELTTLRNQLRNILDVNSYEDQKLDNSARNNIKSDIASLTKMIDVKRNLFKPANNTQRLFRIFDEMVVNKQNEVTRIEVDGNTINYKFPDVEALPTRVTKYVEYILSQMGRKPYLYSAIEEPEYDSEGNATKGQLLNMFRLIKSESSLTTDEARVAAFMSQLNSTVKSDFLKQLKSERKLTIIQKALENEFTEESLINVVKEVAHDESTIAGNTVDRLTRTAFTIGPGGKYMKPEKPAKMSQRAFDNLFGTDGIVTKLQDSVIDGTYEILSDDVIIFDKGLLDSGLVGAMDLIVFDRKNEELKIIDLKTGKESNWKSFNNEESEFSKKLSYRMQLSIYRALLFNMTGILAKNISILPVSITTDKDGNITSAESAAKILNAEKLRELKTKKLVLEKESPQDAEAIKNVELQIKTLEDADTIPLTPIPDDVLAKYGIVMKAPVLPEELQAKSIQKKPATPKLSIEEIDSEIKKIKNKLKTIEKKISQIPNAGVTEVNGKLEVNPLLKKYEADKEGLLKDLENLEKQKKSAKKSTTKAKPKAPVSELTEGKVLEILTETSKKFGIVELNKDNSENIDEEYIVQQIKDTLNTLGLPYKDVVAIRKSTYNVINSKGESVEILKLLQMGGAPLPAKITAAKYLNSLTKEEKIEYARKQLDAELAPLEGIPSIESKVTLENKIGDEYNIMYNGEVVGTVVIPMDLEGDTISLGDINIKPEFRNQGLGIETYKAVMNLVDKPIESFDRTPEAKRVWESLVRQGLATKTPEGNYITISKSEDVSEGEESEEGDDQTSRDLKALRGDLSELDDVFPKLQEIAPEDLVKVINQIKEAKNLEELEEAKADAFILMIQEPTLTSLNKIVMTAYDTKKAALNLDLSEENINSEGEYVLSKESIFGKNWTIAQDEVVYISKISEDKVTLKQVQDIVNGKPKTRRISISKLKSSFTKINEEALNQEPEQDMTVTPEENEKSEISVSSMKDFRQNPDLINAAKEKAQTQSKADLIAALKNNNKDNNIKNCKPTKPE